MKGLSSPKDPDKKQILTVTDTDINLMYTASVIGEDIEVTSRCIPEFFDKDNPVDSMLSHQGKPELKIRHP